MTTGLAMAATRPEDMSRSRAWADRCLAKAASLPLSFVLDGRAIRGIPEDWKPVSRRHRIDANIVETVIEGNDPGTGLNVRFECTQYLDYPVVEWVAWFTAKGRAPTPLLGDILALDETFDGASPVLHHSNGDFCSAEGYMRQETSLRAGETLRFAPKGGRACDSAFPYYRIQFAGGGITMAIGWPTQWSASFERTADGVHVKAGQEKTNLRLLPGETIRTPRMTVLSWEDDASRAVNLWRRWYLAHILPRPNGQPLCPLLACCCTDPGEEFTAATEENQLRYIPKFAEHGIHPDIWWIDAGWYPCEPYAKAPPFKWWSVYAWEPDPKRFPRGLKPVSDCAARAGADLLTWFEPERVWPGSRLDSEHPEWLLRTMDKGDSSSPDWSTTDNGLLNLGIPECRQWLTDHVCRTIRENGIKIYRQDHNFPPLEHWRRNEAPDRQGINENLYVQGYLRFWDDLLARNPGLWIDSCSAGGRRNDLETMRRSVPLHYSDFGYGNPPVKLDFHRTLYEWIPYFKDVTLCSKADDPAQFEKHADAYAYHGGMAPMLFSTVDPRSDDCDFALASKMIGVWRQASGLLLGGDYYPLTPSHRSAAKWTAWQFDCPEEGRGLIQAIRLPLAEGETLTVHPKALRTDGAYRFDNAETGETREIPGTSLLRDGFTLALPKRSGAIWFYRACER